MGQLSHRRSTAVRPGPDWATDRGFWAIAEASIPERGQPPADRSETVAGPVGAKTKECKCRRDSHFGSAAKRCYNHAAFVLLLTKARIPPRGFASPGSRSAS